MNFNLVEMYNGLLRFNKHILNELAEGLKHLPNLDGVSKGDSLIINEQGNPAWGSAAARSSWLINLFSVFVFLDTTPATVYYNNIKSYIS